MMTAPGPAATRVPEPVIIGRVMLCPAGGAYVTMPGPGVLVRIVGIRLLKDVLIPGPHVIVPPDMMKRFVDVVPFRP